MYDFSQVNVFTKLVQLIKLSGYTSTYDKYTIANFILGVFIIIMYNNLFHCIKFLRNSYK